MMNVVNWVDPCTPICNLNKTRPQLELKEKALMKSMASKMMRISTPALLKEEELGISKTLQI